MEVYVVQPGDTINSIATMFNVSIERLISDNGLVNPFDLVTGQALIILYPKETYTVKSGDTLETIAAANNISLMQLYRNNPFLYNRAYINPGEPLAIQFNTVKDIWVNGFTYIFINRELLKMTLPYLTYLSIFNYRISEDATIISYGDDMDIIQIAKEYQTIPLMMISAFSPTGELNLSHVYDLLLDEEKQDYLVSTMLQIVKTKGFMGVNSLISHINQSNQNLYLNVLTKLSNALRNEGYYMLLTIDPNLTIIDDEVFYEKIDYISLSKVVDQIIFLQNVWGINRQPPSPISNISLIRPLIEYVSSLISPELLSVGKPLIGYDWSLPFIPNIDYATSLSLNSAIILASEYQATIHLDEESQTPYFSYARTYVGPINEHVVWFIDARSIQALNELIIDYELSGTGIWNITSSNQQLWTIVNATFYIIKLTL